MQEYSNEERQILLHVARDSIVYGLQHSHPIPLDLAQYPQHLQQSRACFVTLHLDDKLRGCIGTLEAHQALVLDVSQNAFNASFRDPRFNPVTGYEIPNISLEISVLSKPSPMQFKSEGDLLQQIRPGIDGLIISDHGNRGTFLPSVWEQLPAPRDFLQHLKVKAGLPYDYWSATLKVERYTTELIK